MEEEITRVMVVEDEKIVAMEIQDRLNAMGYNVVAVVSSGEDAVNVANKKKLDLVLMDIKLKGLMDGVQAAELIRSKIDIPIIYLTAYADKETLQRAKITEPFGYILKPFDERELYTTIEMALYKHKMERKLKESEQWFATTLNSISDAVIATNKDGYITFMNPVAEKLTGWLVKDAAGESLTNVYIVVNKKDDKISKSQDEIIKTSDRIGDFTNFKVLISKDKSERIIEDSISPIQNENGQMTGVVLIFRDITNKKRFENELIKIQKLESLGVLAGGIAHDYNNALTTIIGNISLIKSDVQKNTETSQMILEIEKATSRAKSLTRQLLTFSKGGEPVKKTINLRETIRNAVSFALKGTHIKIDLKLPENMPLVKIDEAQVTQALYNIFLNSKQAKPDDDKIIITVEKTQSSFNENLAIKPGKYLKISVIDRGEGIAPEHQSKIFDPYFTTKESANGLGLAISYSIIRRHEGTIIVESKVTIGTKVSVYLPIVSEETPVSVKKKSDDKIEKKGKILIMDDESLIRNLVHRMLTLLGHKPEVARNGEEAVKKYVQAIKANDPFDVVILDLTVQGGLGGKETIQKLRHIDPKVKAIVSSGYSNDPIMANYSAYGFCGVVAKPYETHELSVVLNEILNS